jgi:hypothetical protein
MGNLATETFSGPSLVDELGVAARAAGGGVLCKSSRVIQRPVSIRPVTIGIAFRSSLGF